MIFVLEWSAYPKNSKFEVLSFDIDKNRCGSPRGAVCFLAIWLLAGVTLRRCVKIPWTSAATEKRFKSICMCHLLSDVALHKVVANGKDVLCSA